MEAVFFIASNVKFSNKSVKKRQMTFTLKEHTFLKKAIMSQRFSLHGVAHMF